MKELGNINKVAEKIDLLSEEDVKELAFSVLDEFEETLSKHNIVVPDEDREGAEGEASLYGGEYYDLENRVIDCIKKALEKNKKEKEDKELELTEDEMSKLILDSGLGVSEDDLEDSTIIFDYASQLGFESVLIEETQTYKFKK